MSVNNTHHFGTLPNGEDVRLARLRAGNISAQIISYGAIVQDFRFDGVDHPLVLGSPTLEPYFNEMKYFGAIVGPIANRLQNGRAELNGEIIQLDQNENGKTTLHGGSSGLDQVNWEFAEVRDDRCMLTTKRAHLADGLPGNLEISAEFILHEHNALEVVLSATTDRPTFCNLAHHGYWNLSGEDDLRNHELQILADHYLPVDADKIPTGEVRDVSNTRFDYRAPRSILSKGEDHLDHNFCLNPSRKVLRPACVLRADQLEIEVRTSEPGLQVYDGQGISAEMGLDGRTYRAMAGIALEPQKWPDAPNQTGFPSILIVPESPYFQRSEFHIRKR